MAFSESDTPVFDATAIENLRKVAGDDEKDFILEMAQLFLDESAKSLAELTAEVGAWQDQRNQHDDEERARTHAFMISPGMGGSAKKLSHFDARGKARMVDVGANWYLNQFVKVYFDWEHALFGNPVLSTNGQFRQSNDLFWVRTQVYF